MTATLLSPPEVKPTSRRALLAGALGGLGAWAASAIGRTSPVQAEGETMVVGGEYDTATSPTRLVNNANNFDVFAAYSNLGGIAVSGASSANVGVYGLSNSTSRAGVLGEAGGHMTGVLGWSGSVPGAPAAKAKTGVYGYCALGASAVGVRGESPAGLAVYGRTSTGYAGYFNGKVYSSQFYELGEIATPAAPVDHRARLYIRDSGGKAQLCVRFHTGVIKVLATEP